VDHVVERLIDIVRSETDDPISVGRHPRVSPIIPDDVMGIAINLNYKARDRAKEIGEVRPDRHLPPKLEPTDLPIAQP
jgi:hypothetical protein